MVTSLLLGTLAAVVLLLIPAKWVYTHRHLLKWSMKTGGPSLWKILKLFGKTNAENIYESMVKIWGSYADVDCGWFGPQLVVLVKAPETLKVVLNSPHALGKGFFFEFFKPIVGDGLGSAPPAIWKRHRKLLNPTFNPKIIDNFVEMFAEGSTELAEELQQYDGKGVFNLEEEFTKSTMSTLCKTAMGLKDLHQKSQLIEIAEKLNRITNITLMRIVNVFYHPDLIFYQTKIGKEVTKLINDYRYFIDNVIKVKRLQLEEKANSCQVEDTNMKWKVFLDYLLEISEDDNDNKFTDQEIFEEVAMFIFAGTDTSAATLANIFCMLAMHPEVQEKVYHETVDILGPDRVALPEDMSKFKYTERVIKETLRLFPIAPFTTRYVAEDLVVNDKVTVPKGAEMLMCIMELHRNPEYFPNPLVFNVDRFLPEEVNKRHPYSHVPFSGGSRNCIGINYAMKIMKVFISTLIRKYQFFTEYTKVEEVEIKWSITSKSKHGHKVFLVSRK